ncbi:MAG TPA: restriction endonuclease subunit S [Balneolaceae bacterium]|nr:restriction endonuclease subunit S [Balneolaceae bacterium]
MSDWAKVELSELLTLVIDHRGKTPKKMGFDDFFSKGYPVLSAKHIKNGDLVNLDNLRYGNNEMYKKWMKEEVKKEDIILTSEAPLGETYYIDNDQKYILGQRVFGLRVNKEKVVPKYLEIWLSSLKGQQELFKRASGSTVQGIKQTELLKITVDIPPLEIQEKIATIGDSLSKKIKLNTQTNQTLEQIAQATFKHWFIDFAPVHAKANALARGETIEQAELAAMACLSGKTVEKITALKAQDPTAYHQLQQTAQAFPSEFVESEMGLVPKGWEVLKFKDFVKETKEKVGKLQGIEEYSVGNEGIYPRKEKYKKQLAKDPSKNKLIREANIVFGMGNKEVNWGIMRDKIGSVSSAYNIFQINDINHLFLDMFINNIPYYFRDIIKPTSRQGQTIDKEAFLEKAIYYPNKEIINIFLEKITQINELSICIKSQNIYLLSIRDYLLPKLLGGEIKL